MISSHCTGTLLEFIHRAKGKSGMCSRTNSLILILGGIERLGSCVRGRCRVTLRGGLRLLRATLRRPLTVRVRHFIHLIDRRHEVRCLLEVLCTFLRRCHRTGGVGRKHLVATIPTRDLRRELRRSFREGAKTRIRLRARVGPRVVKNFIFRLSN